MRYQQTIDSPEVSGVGAVGNSYGNFRSTECCKIFRHLITSPDPVTGFAILFFRVDSRNVTGLTGGNEVR